MATRTAPSSRRTEPAPALGIAADGYRALVESAGDAIVLANRAGVITSFNPAAERIFGYSADEALGQPLTLLMPERFREAHQAGLARFLATGEARVLGRTVELSARRKDGREFPIELTLSTWSDGDAPFFSGILRDISDRKRGEQYFATERAVLEVLTHSSGLEEALPRVLEAIAEGTGWELGGIWTVDDAADVLRCRALWHAPAIDAAKFDALSSEISFAPGEGLPGRIWSSGSPAWIEDVQRDSNFPRLPAAVENGLHGAIGLPLTSGSEFVGVIEFFSRQARPPDEHFLAMLTALGRQIGDFLKRSATERALSEAQERFGSAFHDAPTGMALFDAEREGPPRLLEVNRELCSITGYSKEELEDRTVYDLIHPEDLAADRDAFDRLLSGDADVYRKERRFVHAHGEVAWMSMTASLVNGHSDEPACGIAQIVDITERRRAEERLAALAAIVEAADDAIVGKSLDGTITSWNPGAERLYGYSAAEAVGRPISILIPAGHEDEVPALLERVGRGESIDRYDTVRVRKDGSRVDVALTLAPTPDRHGKIVGAAVVARDITDRKRAEGELAAAAAELQRSNEELERFGSIVAHDLSEPLRVVSGFAELLGTRYGPRLDDEGSRFVGAIGNSADRMQRLIDDLLVYARVGRESERKPVDCRELVDETLAGLARRSEETGATVTVDDLPTVNGDATQIGQLFQNLIGNALKFADDGPPEVHVSAEREAGAWRFSVRDNGIGIDPKHAERIFEPFRRLHPHDAYSGTGIGLAICKRIVEFHGGRIWVEPAPGGGSVFSFTIAD